jgi:hypothetical protein
MSNRESRFKSRGTTKTGKAGDAIDVAARCMGWVSQREPFPGRLSVSGSLSM